MALSVDPPAVAPQMVSRREVHFPLLRDPQGRVIRQYRMYNPETRKAHMGYVLIDAHGRVRARAVDPWFGTHGATLLQYLADLDAVPPPR